MITLIISGLVVMLTIRGFMSLMLFTAEVILAKEGKNLPKK